MTPSRGAFCALAFMQMRKMGLTTYPSLKIPIAEQATQAPIGLNYTKLSG